MRVLVTPTVYPRVFEILTTLTFGALRKKSQCVTDIRGHHKENEKKKKKKKMKPRRPRVVSNVS